MLDILYFTGQYWPLQYGGDVDVSKGQCSFYEYRSMLETLSTCLESVWVSWTSLLVGPPSYIIVYTADWTTHNGRPPLADFAVTRHAIGRLEK